MVKVKKNRKCEIIISEFRTFFLFLCVVKC